MLRLTVLAAMCGSAGCWAPRRPLGPRMTRRAAGADDERVFELCRLDGGGDIVDCSCYTAAELEARGLLGPLRAARLAKGGKGDLLFSVPDPGGGGETLFSVADWDECLAEEVCDVPDDVINKVYGPDVLARMRRNATAAAPPTPSERSARFHMHFGAGRLGLGLVVPAIAASGVPFAVVQRPKPRWEEIFSQTEESTVELTVNDEVTGHNLEVIIAHDGGRAPATLPASSLVFGAETADLRDVLLKTTSFSCSLGAAMNKVMRRTLEALPELMTEAEVVGRQRAAERLTSKLARQRRYSPGYDAGTAEYSGDLDPAEDPRPVLYCAENDHDAVARLKKALRTRVRVVDCMVDRVCTGRRIRPTGVEIDAEPWPGAIVVLEPGFEDRMVPFAPRTVTLPETLRHADYLSERKFSLVNGMHTVLAFLTLDAIYDSRSSGREYVLLKYTAMRRATQRRIEAWRTARVAKLLDEFGVDNVARWEGADSAEGAWDALLDFSDVVLVERFSAIDDLVSRVLGGGVANRYQTRLKPTKKWLDAAPASDFFLHAARRDRANAIERLGNGACDIASGLCDVDDEVEDECASAAEAAERIDRYLAELLTNARKFCNKELEITHKQLIKEQRRSGGKKFSPAVQEAIAQDRAEAQAIVAERAKTRARKQRELDELYSATDFVQTRGVDPFNPFASRTYPNSWKYE